MEGLPIEKDISAERPGPTVEQLVDMLSASEHALMQKLAGEKQEHVIAAGETMDATLEEIQKGSLVGAGVEALTESQ